ncbi:MAG: FKBP-type peptidyl-prolyl cis-trans isomerase [Bacteroidales bacterium]|nr:FKBP-type peptidyl-prolyl cis-trans isomerase [Bacteroidales bacterium]
MKTLRISVLLLAVTLMAASCLKAPSFDPQPKGLSKADIDTASYTIGVYLAKMVTNNDIGDLNLAKIVAGYKAAVKDLDDTRFDQDYINDNMSNFSSKRVTAQSMLNIEAGNKFFEKLDKDPDVVKTESGLRYKIIRPGSDVKPVMDQDTVTVYYEGTTVDGTVFDTTYSEDSDPEPVSFPLDMVIEGWTEGIKYVGEGGEIMLYVPATLGYGMYGPMGPEQTLVFKVELLEVKPFQGVAE